jgi:hypothetical protein
MDEPTLDIVFTIFSKIEKNNALALQILEMMCKNTSTTSEIGEKPSEKSNFRKTIVRFYSFLCKKLESRCKILEKIRTNLGKS